MFIPNDNEYGERWLLLCTFDESFDDRPREIFAHASEKTYRIGKR